jgi:DNA-binding NarL/FixJ family response regulator
MRISFVEDHRLLRAGLVRLLHDAGHEVVSEHDDADDLLTTIDARAPGPPDLVVTDVRLPPSHTDEGIRAAVALRRRTPPVPVLVLSQYVERRHAVELVADDDGGFGYLLKDRVSDVDTFLDAVEVVAAGGTVIDPHVIRQLLRRTSPTDRLTPREQDVLELIAQGRSNRAIAEQLVISSSAVEKYIGNIFMRLDLPHEDVDHHRRVRAAVLWLDAASS